MNFDVFLSHATEDKPEVVWPLASRLKKLGLRVWIDDEQIELGDSLYRAIDLGLSTSRFAVVILSRSFFRSEWAKKELGGLLARESGKGKVILPIWHRVKDCDVKDFSPILSDRFAISTAVGIDAIAEKVFAVAQGSATACQPESVETSFEDKHSPLNRTGRRNSNASSILMGAAMAVLHSIIIGIFSFVIYKTRFLSMTIDYVKFTNDGIDKGIPIFSEGVVAVMLNSIIILIIVAYIIYMARSLIARQKTKEK